MERILFLEMLNKNALEQRIKAEQNGFFAQEMGFRELVCLKQETAWDDIIKCGEMELHQLGLVLNEHDMLTEFRSNIIGSFALDELVEKEKALNFSIIAFQNRLNRAEECLKASDCRSTEVLQEKVRNWNEEKKALELQMAQLCTRIAALSEQPVLLPVIMQANLLKSDLKRNPTEITTKDGIHIYHI